MSNLFDTGSETVDRFSFLLFTLNDFALVGLVRPFTVGGFSFASMGSFGSKLKSD